MKEQKYYYGNAISEYGLENGRVDYATLAVITLFMIFIMNV
nr:MAG TPA: hypothetical protein [Caudoviricetes sp.]